MKKIMCRAKSFIIHDFPIQTEYISTQFAKTHQKLQVDIPEWSTEATRQKLISQYWFSYVTTHFAMLTGFPSLAVFLAYTFGQANFYAVSILIAGLLSFSILYIFQYLPNFRSIFLPRLQTIKEAYERKQAENVEKCRQAQLSNFALTLFFYVLTESNTIHYLKCDDNSANLLMKLYGVDPGSLKKNLELILSARKRQNLSERKITEIQNRFNETYLFLEELGYGNGITKLKELEAKFFLRPKIS